MAKYTLEHVTLIGTERQSEHSLQIRLDESRKVSLTWKSWFHIFIHNLKSFPPVKDWFCSKVAVTTPEGDEILFPCHKRLSTGEAVLLRGRRGLSTKLNRTLCLVFFCRFKKYAQGLAYVLNINDPKLIPEEIRFSYSKAFQFRYVLEKYVSKHWKNDDLFGYQCLNEVNPTVIQRCSELPSNFPLTEDMVRPFLANGSSLSVEIKMGNIFISDYKIMEGLPTRVIDGKPVPVTALSIFILSQHSQQPSEENPIFLPSNSKSDWLLAKVFVRNADALCHQLVVHLQNTHLLSEVFPMATLRNLPQIHPLHKMLIPHLPHTLHINIFGRAQLYGPGRILDNVNGLIELMRRGLSQTTDASFCIPEKIAARGLESIPNFYYRDDALRLWRIISSFIKAMVAFYYQSDHEVSTVVFFPTGFPSNFQTVEELIKFVTMVIFTSSYQHAAVNSGQVFGWDPNEVAPPVTLMRIKRCTENGWMDVKLIGLLS
uniref:Si:dkey-17e16.9 n=1 Tax=Stegastes partitus TaxID=144197 RepID=A0A3B5A0L5_9TELE